MEFLYKLYSNQYFALVLFSVIAILLVLFVIVLVAAIHDTKKRKLENINEMEKKDLSEVEDKVKSSLMEEIKATEEIPAFTEESNEIELETPKMDITLETPTSDNSMNSLLDEFETSEIDLLSDKTDLSSLIAQVAPESEEINSTSIDDDYVDDFELPAIKKVETIEEISEDELPKMSIERSFEELAEESKSEIPEIDLGKTGVLNFSNIETESYDIKK